MRFPEFRVERQGSEYVLVCYEAPGTTTSILIARFLTEREANKFKKSQGPHHSE